MRIGIDVMGGDHAPDVVTHGAVLAVDYVSSDVRLVLIGDEPKVRQSIEEKGGDPSRFDYIHASETIEMCDNPSKSFTTKPESGIALGFKNLKLGVIDCFASAGNTGAMMVGAMHVVKNIPGVIRPCIGTIMPRLYSKPSLIVDVGLNPDARPDVLYQYAIMGSIYSQNVMKIDNPRVALLNIGEEEEKGNLNTKATYQLMKDTKDFNFTGNVEGNELFHKESADVLVCDGFVGNIVLKQAEGIYTLSKELKLTDPFFEQFNFENYGGTAVLGINAPVIIAHGRSNEIAIKSMILHSVEIVEAKIYETMKEVFNNL